MKVTLVLLAMFAAPVNPHDYPMHVRIVAASSSGYTTMGYGNYGVSSIMMQGFEFTTDCGRLEPSRGASEFYRAQIDTEKRTMTILASKIGETKIKTCKFKYTAKPFLYDVNSEGQIIVHELPK